MKIIKDQDLKKIISFLKKDRVVALPTETVYGFFGNGLKKEVVDRIFELKKREKDNG